MAKNKAEKVEEAVEEPKLGKLEIEFNNEGLNSLRDKLNEVIEFVNK